MIAKLLVLLLLAGAAWIWWRRHMTSRPTMRPAEARALLGVGEQASLQEIREAHRRLISRVHPDAGGTADLATRVNAARDALVAELNRRSR